MGVTFLNNLDTYMYMNLTIHAMYEAHIYHNHANITKYVSWIFFADEYIYSVSQGMDVLYYGVYSFF